MPPAHFHRGGTYKETQSKLKINNKRKFLPQQREEIDLMRIRLRRTPATEERARELEVDPAPRLNGARVRV